MELFLVAALGFIAGRKSSHAEEDRVLPAVVPIVFTYAAFRVLDAIYNRARKQLGAKSK